MGETDYLWLIFVFAVFGAFPVSALVIKALERLQAWLRR